MLPLNVANSSAFDRLHRQSAMQALLRVSVQRKASMRV
jgi:hypothetical protein